MNNVEQFVTALNSLDISNVYIYVGDAVRSDFLHGDISDKGTTIKSVAASITSAPSFSSLVSGLHPGSHGVYTFNNQLRVDTFTIFNIPGHRTGFFNSIFKFAERGHDGSDPIYSVLNISGTDSIRRLNDMDTPFVHMERGPGGHLPYGDYSQTSEYFLQKLNSSILQDDYCRSIELDAELFAKRLELLDRQGLREDTLVIYTSDHGELLGEGGLVGHNSPMRPELAYVPCVFIHNQLPNIEINSALFHHTDLLPTILSKLNVDLPEISFDGESIVDNLSNNPRCSVYQKQFSTELPIIRSHVTGDFKYEGVWDSNGGYVFPRVGLSDRFLVLSGQLIKSPKKSYMRNNILQAIQTYYKGDQRFGEPNFSKVTANSILNKTDVSGKKSKDVELSDKQKEHLKDLGYL